MNEIENTGLNPTENEKTPGWDEHFRELQLLGAELAKVSGVELEDVPQVVRKGIRAATPDELAEAQKILEDSLIRRQNKIHKAS